MDPPTALFHSNMYTTSAVRSMFFHSEEMSSIYEEGEKGVQQVMACEYVVYLLAPSATLIGRRDFESRQGLRPRERVWPGDCQLNSSLLTIARCSLVLFRASAVLARQLRYSSSIIEHALILFQNRPLSRTQPTAVTISVATRSRSHTSLSGILHPAPSPPQAHRSPGPSPPGTQLSNASAPSPFFLSTTPARQP